MSRYPTETTRDSWLISTESLAAQLDAPDLLVFDCTTRLLPDARTIYRAEPGWMTFCHGHIPGAQFIDVQRDLSDNDHRYKFMLPSAGQFSAAMTRLGLSPDKRVVLYSCGDPWWATRVWWLLRVFGFHQAVVLDGGWQKWQREQRPQESGSGRTVSPGHFQAHLDARRVVQRDEVLSAISDEHVCLLSARQPSSFRGEDGNQYGRPGRIAGSDNVPAAQLFDADTGTLLPTDKLRDTFSSLALDHKRVIAYCGHGIAASAVVFALTLLGHPDVALYDASLSEWAASDELPMAIG